MIVPHGEGDARGDRFEEVPHRVEREDALEGEIGPLELGLDRVIEVAPGVDVRPGPIQLAGIDPADPLPFEASGQVAEDAHGALSRFRPVAILGEAPGEVFDLRADVVAGQVWHEETPDGRGAIPRPSSNPERRRPTPFRGGRSRVATVSITINILYTRPFPC
jgi:hypothetical protein